jgi:hypothetical protein
LFSGYLAVIWRLFGGYLAVIWLSINCTAKLFGTIWHLAPFGILHFFKKNHYLSRLAVLGILGSFWQY